MFGPSARLTQVEARSARLHSRWGAGLIVPFFLLASPASGEAQGIAAIVSKIAQLEQQMDELGRSRQRDLAQMTQEVAELKSNTGSPASQDEADEAEARLTRLETELHTLRLAVEARPSDELPDSLSRVLGSLVDRIEVFLAGPPPGESIPSTPAQLPDPPVVQPQLAPALPVTFGGQVRPRYESRQFGSGAGANSGFTSMRVRGTITAQLERDVTVVIEIQDVRLWGEEANTLGDFRADNFDLHQGYIQASRIGGQPVSARVGRQAVSFGGQRLIGAVEWTQQGRVFDGAKVTVRGTAVTLDLIGMNLAESSAAPVDIDASLFGVYAAFPITPRSTLDVYGLHNRVSAALRTAESTWGARWHGSHAGITYRVEGSYQSGERAGSDVSAFMLGARVGTSLADGQGTVTLWYDYLSGDDVADPKAQSFSTLFATNHKFYGFADLFLNVPADTGGHGLQDFAVKFSATANARTKLALALHSFRAAQVGALASAHFADEADLTVTYQFSKQLSVVGGFSHVLGGDALAEIGRLQSNQSFTYMMTSVRF